MPELKGNTEKVARAGEQQVNFGALRSAGPIPEHSADNLVPREPGSTMPGYHMYMVSNGIMDGTGYNPAPTLVPKYSSDTVKIVRGLKAECRMKPSDVQKDRALKSMLRGEPPSGMTEWPTEVSEVPQYISPFLV